MNWLRALWDKIMHRKPKPPSPPPAPNPSPKVGFSDDFTNLNNWIVSAWAAPGGGTFAADHVDLSQGLLGIKLSQSASGSIGGELQCRQTFGYGTYTWVMKAGSTASTPDAHGSAVSGGVSGCFNYINNSQTEIDFEVEGLAARSSLIQLTNWTTTAAQQNTNVPLSPPPEADFRRYKFVWTPGRLYFYVDDSLVAAHTQNVPSTPAYPMINHWGTNDASWGGLATPGVERWMWVKSFSFTPSP